MMTRLVSLCSLLVLLAAPALAQHGPHQDQVTRAQENLRTAGIDISGDCGAARVTNLAVQYIRQAGDSQAGILKKNAGSGCLLDGHQLVAKDAIVYPNGEVYDVLIASGAMGGNGQASWNRGADRTDVACPCPPGLWSNPVDPAIYGFTLGSSPASTSPQPPGTPAVVRAPAVDLSPLQARIATLEQQLNALVSTIDNLAAWSDRVETRFNGDEGRLSTLEAQPLPTRCTGYVNVFGYHAPVSGCTVR